MRVLILFFISLLFFSCEEEDICLEGSTPRLVIETVNTSQASISIDSVQIFRNQGNQDSMIYKGTLSQQYKIPLLLKEAPFTKFTFKIYQKNQIIQDEFIVGYNYKLKYASKACGYRVLYDSLNVKFKPNFFKKVEVLKPVLDHEAAPHLRFSH